MNFPDHSLQGFTGEWWEQAPGHSVGFGTLLEVFVHHMDKLPIQLITEGRVEPTAHGQAKMKAIPFNIRRHIQRAPVPIAALPSYPGESYIALRGKVRPAIVLGADFSAVSQEDKRRHLDWQTAPVFLVAPFYGVERTDERNGFHPEFVERVQKAYYKQFLWDRLPSGALELCSARTREGSMLRFDHIVPVGSDPSFYRNTGYRLNDDGQRLIKEWLEWVWFNDMREDSFLLGFRSQFISAE
ncbi:MAG: hypothetical protein Q8O00_01000 [Holophaga sp.]|nr:hypothetical protein [Holophaga sp.]